MAKTHRDFSAKPHSSTASQKKKSPQNKFTAKCKYSLQQCLPKCWCSCSISPSGTWATVREAGTWTWIFREGFHLQVLLLSGEGVGEALHCLRFVFCYFWLDGLCDFLNHRINLFQEAMGLVDLIHLRGQREKMTKPVKLYYFLVIHRSEWTVRNKPAIRWMYHNKLLRSVVYILEIIQKERDGKVKPKVREPQDSNRLFNLILSSD